MIQAYLRAGNGEALGQLRRRRQIARRLAGEAAAVCGRVLLHARPLAAAGEDAARTRPSPARSKGDGYVVEMLHYQSRPQLYVTGNLYRPAKVEGGREAAGGVLRLRPFRPRPQRQQGGLQSHGIWFARHGYVCLVVDTLQLGEIAATHHGTYNLQPLVVALARLHAGRRRALERRPGHRLPRQPAATSIRSGSPSPASAAAGRRRSGSPRPTSG